MPPSIYGEIKCIVCEYCGIEIRFGAKNDDDFGEFHLMTHQEDSECKRKFREKRINKLLNKDEC